MPSKSQLDYAQKLYLNGDYAQAAESFDTMSKQDANNPYLLINTGNAYYRSGDYGKALAKYYQAKKYIPRDKDLNHNTQILLDELKLEQPAMLGYAYMTLFESFLFLLLCNILFIFRRKFLAKTALRYLMIVIFSFSVLNFLFIANNQAMKHHAVIVAATHARSGNSEQFPDLFELLPGQIVELVGSDEGWSEISVDGKRGWVAKAEIDSI